MDRGPAVALIVAAATCSLFLSACTPPANGVNSPTPPPATPSAMPTPPETAQERLIRLDQEAAVSAYRAAFSEVERVLIAGGATQATPTLSAVTTNDYLELVVRFWRQAHRDGLRLSGKTRVLYAAPIGWSASKISIKACEDATASRFLDSKGRDRTPPGDARYVQNYTVVKVGDIWKVSDVDTQRVKSFDEYGCTS